MKIIKVIFFILLGIIAVWAVSMLFSLVTTLLPILFALVLFYFVGRVAWKMLNKKKSHTLTTEMEHDLAGLAQTERKLAEIKRQQQVKQ